jgi:hypothetical protein
LTDPLPVRRALLVDLTLTWPSEISWNEVTNREARIDIDDLAAPSVHDAFENVYPGPIHAGVRRIWYS